MRMKRFFVMVPLAALAFGAIVPSYAMDPCKVLLCMAGRVQGQGTVSGCSDAVTYYFSEPYKVYIYHSGGRTFVPPATQQVRNGYVRQCASANQENQSWAQQISNRYGMMEYDNGS